MAATRLFAVKGYAATTVRDLLREAGVTAPVLYYHFGNKEGVFLALAREATEKLDAALKKALGQARSASAKIRGQCRVSAAVRREYAELAWIVDAILSGPPEAAPRFDFRARVTQSMHRLEGFVRQGIESGEFRPCDTRYAALAIMGAVEIAARHRIFGTATTSPDESLEKMLSLIFKGLNAPSASGEGRRRRAS